MINSLLRSLKCRQIGQTQMQISVNGTAGTPVASGPDAAFISSITDNGVGSYTITFKEAAKIAPFVTGIVPITSGAMMAVSASTVSSITIAAASNVGTKASKVFQDITYTARMPGVAGNSITIAYTAGATAGSEVVSVIGNAISVQIETGVSTATQVHAAVEANAEAMVLVAAAITGTAGTAQVTATALPLLLGTNVVAMDADFNVQWQFMDQLSYYF